MSDHRTVEQANRAARWQEVAELAGPMLQAAAEKLAPRGPDGERVMSPARKEAQLRRRTRLYEYPGKAEADAHLAAMKGKLTPPPGVRQRANPHIDIDEVRRMLRERPERVSNLHEVRS